MLNSSPPASGLLQALLNEPHTLASLASALRVCNHPDAVTLAGTGFCAMCGATAAGLPKNPDDWNRPAIVQLISDDVLTEYEYVTLSLREISACVDQLQGRSASAVEIDEIRRALRELLESASMRAGVIVGQAGNAIDPTLPKSTVGR